MTERWSGRLHIGSGWATWSGLVGPNQPHGHYAGQAVIAAESPVVVEGADRHHEGRCLLIEPGAVHRLRSGDLVILYFLEPAGRGPEASDLRRTLQTMPEAKVLGGGSLLGGEPETFWRRWLTRTPMELDARVARAVDSIEERVLDGSVSLAGAARTAHLSVDPFRHLFTAQVGIPFSRFVLWRRLSAALRSLAAGTDATSAAQDAGFADSPHLSRTVRAMFGVSLTEAGLLGAGVEDAGTNIGNENGLPGSNRRPDGG